MSSAAVYGNPEELPVSESCVPRPISPYGFHKLMAEHAVLEYATLHGLRAASLRVFSAYGPGLKRQVIWDIGKKLATDSVLRLQGTGDESRDFVHVEDVVGAVAAVVQRGDLRGETYNVGHGAERSIADVASRLVSRLAPAARVEFDGSLPAGTPRRWRADISRLTALGFRPERDFERSLAECADWMKAELSAENGITWESA
jgi:UDP-glucose 4-epimerase